LGGSTDRRLFQHAGLLALAAAGAVFGMHRRQEHGVTAGTRLGTMLERDRLVDDRADAVADIAAQAEEVEAGFVVDQHRQPIFALLMSVSE
jgi:hypothetical protein